MLMYQKSIFDRYYCISTFCRSKTLEKLLRKVFFPVPIMARKARSSDCFENAASRAKTNVILTSRNNVCYCVDDDVNFCDGPGMHICKTAIRALTARELPC